MTRNEKALSLAGGVWVRERREALGWSAAKLALRTRMMQRCQGLRGRLPSTADILALEAGGLTKLPRWLTLVQDVFAFNDVARDERAAWIDRRNWRYADHPIDLSEILVFRDEAMLLELLGGMDELDRRAWRAVLTRWPMRGGREDERIAAAQEWLRRMGLEMAALTPDEELLLRRFRQLPQEKRSEFNEHMGDQLPWPPPPPFALSDDEMDLVLGYVSKDADSRDLLLSMATKPGMLAAVIAAIKTVYGTSPDAEHLEGQPSS